MNGSYKRRSYETNVDDDSFNKQRNDFQFQTRKRKDNCKRVCSSDLDYFVPYFLVKGSVNVIIFIENFVKNRRKEKRRTIKRNRGMENYLILSKENISSCSGAARMIRENARIRFDFSICHDSWIQDFHEYQNYLRIPITNKWNEKFKLHKNATDNFHEYLYNLILRQIFVKFT